MFSLLAFASTVSAASNAFTNPISNITVNTGSNLNITWQNASGTAVDIVLRTGQANNLKYIASVGSSIPNQGEFTWLVPSNLTTGEYALEITSDTDEDNYSAVFTIVGETAANATSSDNSTTSASSSTSSSSSVTTSSSSSVATTTSDSTTSDISAPTVLPYANITSSNNGTTAATIKNNGTAPAVTTSPSAGAFINGTAATASSTGGLIGANSTSTGTTRAVNGASVLTAPSMAAGLAIAGAAMLLL